MDTIVNSQTDILLENGFREYKLSKSIHSHVTTNKPPMYKDSNLSNTDIDIQKTDTNKITYYM